MKEKMIKLSEQIKNSNNILISAHISPDGDAVGSSFGLALILNNLGKTAKVVKNDDYPTNLEFMYRDDLYYNDEFEEIDLFIAIDTADIKRLGISEKYLSLAKDTAVIDHHVTNKGFSNNDIIYMSSSCCEMVTEISMELGYEIPKEAADYLYLGMLTDTYRFQYPSSDSTTLRMAANLLDFGADKEKIHSELYETMDTNFLFLQTDVIQHAKRIGKQIITAKIPKELVEKYHLDYDKAESLVSILRTIKGIEVAAIVKESDKDDEQKYSFRSQSCVDVAKIASECGGGGHMRASGATVKYKNLDEAYDELNKRLEKIYADGDLVD